MKIVTVVGARPQFVKAATVSRVIAEVQGVTEVIVHTGQHYDANLSDLFFQEMALPQPDHYLGIGGGNHGQMTGRMLEAIEAVLLKEKPDWVLVYGDTNSTLAGALGGTKLGIPIAHVEAGMRCFVKHQPEEINRVLTDHCSDLLLTATTSASQFLEKEGIPSSRIVQVGDVMYDATQFYRDRSIDDRPYPEEYALLTCHRAENTDDPVQLREICDGLIEVSKLIPIVFPLHPRTRNKLSEFGLLGLLSQHTRVIDPVGYLQMIALERHAKLILTDSGGVQREAYFFKVPCVVLRDRTEWIELVQEGGHLLADEAKSILTATKQLLGQTVACDKELFGDGHAAEKIVECMAGALAL